MTAQQKKAAASACAARVEIVIVASSFSEFTKAVTISNWSVAGPPEQWFIPGTGIKRANGLASPEFVAFNQAYRESRERKAPA